MADRVQRGQEALGEGRLEEYATQAASAVDAMPPGLLNRPFVQYHAARAAAWVGRPDEALRHLEAAWSEDIESLMVSFALHDPAFDGVRQDPEIRDFFDRMGDVELSARLLGGDVWLITGTGSNLLAQLGPEGVLLIDTGYAPAGPALLRELVRLGGDRPTRVVITHAHEDHMGSAPIVGGPATLFAHSGTDSAMAEPYSFIEGVTLPPKPRDARPDVLVDADTTIVSNGERVRIVPTVAHTDGDLSVYFEDARVAHLGDTFLPSEPMMFPGDDDPDGFLERMDAFLDSMDPETVVVGGHEAVSTIGAVRDQISATRETMEFTRRVIEEGLSTDEIRARAEGRFPIQWVGFFYQLFGGGA